MAGSSKASEVNRSGVASKTTLELAALKYGIKAPRGAEDTRVAKRGAEVAGVVASVVVEMAAVAAALILLVVYLMEVIEAVVVVLLLVSLLLLALVLVEMLEPVLVLVPYTAKPQRVRTAVPGMVAHTLEPLPTHAK